MPAEVYFTLLLQRSIGTDSPAAFKRSLIFKLIKPLLKKLGKTELGEWPAPSVEVTKEAELDYFGQDASADEEEGLGGVWRGESVFRRPLSSRFSSTRFAVSLALLAYATL